MSIDFKVTERVRLVGVNGRFGSGKNTTADILESLLHEQGNGIIYHVYQSSFGRTLKEIIRNLCDIPAENKMETEEEKNQPLPELLFKTAEGFMHALAPMDIASPNLDYDNILLAKNGATEEQLVQVRKDCDEIRLGAIDNFVMFDLKPYADQECPIHDTNSFMARVQAAMDEFVRRIEAGQVKTIGQALQIFGTECVRNIIGKSFWVLVQKRITMQRLHQRMEYASLLPPLVIIYTDMRFKNEYDFIRTFADLNGKTIRVDRNVDYSKTTRDPNHQSEIELENEHFDIRLDNNGTKQALSSQIENNLDVLLSQ